MSVSDLRVSVSVVPDDAGLAMSFELRTRGHVMLFTLADGLAQVRMRSDAYGDDLPDEGWIGAPAVTVRPLPVGHPTNVEFWHADQTLAIHVGGRRVVSFDYDWGPVERLGFATGRMEEPEELATLVPGRGPELRLVFDGAPFTLHRLRLDRDLHYRTDRLSSGASTRRPTSPGHERLVRAGQYAFGTHPDNLAVLGPDHFFMCGDNSAASSDSRLWGNAHPLVAEQVDDSPFVVNRRLLLGKAWVVYFPAPLSISENGRSFIPDFGQLRFIR